MVSWRRIMHTVELYETAKTLAESMGYQVREENLGGVGGGACDVAGRKCIFVDIALSSVEQLDQVMLSLYRDPIIHTTQVPDDLREMFPLRRAA